MCVLRGGRQKDNLSFLFIGVWTLRQHPYQMEKTIIWRSLILSWIQRLYEILDCFSCEGVNSLCGKSSGRLCDAQEDRLRWGTTSIVEATMWLSSISRILVEVMGTTSWPNPYQKFPMCDFLPLPVCWLDVSSQGSLRGHVLKVTETLSDHVDSTSHVTLLRPHSPHLLDNATGWTS